MITPDEFVEDFKNQEQPNNILIAKVDPGYTSGRPSLVFDTEDTPTVKKYPYLSSYAPAAGDRVMVLRGVVIGKII